MGAPNDIGSSLPRALAQLWHGSGCCNAADVSAGFPGSQVLAPSGSSPGQGMGAWGGTLGTMGPAWQCQPCAQLGLVRFCSCLGYTCAIPCAPLWDVSPSHPHTPKPATPQGWRGCRAGTGMWAAAGCWGPLQGESPPGLPQPPGFCRARPPAGSPWPVKRTRGKRSQRCQMQITSRVTHPDNGVRLILLQWD